MVIPAAARDAVTPDASRARLPDATGLATADDGVRLAYEVFGSGERTLVLLPSAPIVHSRQWKGQVAYLGRHWRVVTYDGRGNGRSDRPTTSDAYGSRRRADDLDAVLAATRTDRAILVGLCSDAVWPGVLFAAAQPERVDGIVAFAVGVPLLTPPHPWREEHSFTEPLPTDEGWAKVNEHYWRRDYEGFARFFFSAITSEPHSTKAIDDAVEWAMDGSVDAMVADASAAHGWTKEAVEDIVRQVRCPMLLVHGTEDHCQPIARAQRFAELTGARLVEVQGADHMIPGRHPVLANLLIAEFVRSLPEVAG